MKRLLIGLIISFVLVSQAFTSQHDYVIDNNPGATVRADINSALQAIVTNNAGATAPSTTYPNMWWFDTATGILKRRNNANDAWISDSSIPKASATGTVDAIIADFEPNISLTDKTIVAVIAYGANTSTAPTFTPDGLTTRTITKDGGSALLAGDIPAAGFVMLLEYNLTNTRWELLNPSSKPYTDTKISKTTSSEIYSMNEKTSIHDDDVLMIEDSESSYAKKKVKKSNLITSNTGLQFFNASGNFTAPTGISKVFVTLCAGGGGGGSSSSAARGGGGGSAACVVNYPYNVTPGSNYTVTIGAGGAGGNPGGGNPGSNSAFDSLSVNGGYGGGQAVSSTPGSGGAGKHPDNETTLVVGAGVAGGRGGHSPFGSGGSSGSTGSGYASGGGGGGDDTNNPGAAGAPGFCMVEW